MTTANLGYGSRLAYSLSGSSYTDVAQVEDITGPSIKVDSVEVTNQDSASAAKEFISGLIDAGELTFSIVYLKTIVTAVYALIRTTYYWKVTLTDSSTWVCQGFLTAIEPGVPVGDKIGVNFTVKFTGKPTFTAA